MMPDLGKYAVPVLGSYAAALGLLGVLVALSVWRFRRMRQALTEAEGRARMRDV
ncbi:MAG: heme exporter protein CcmD [Gemmobacter sp.]|jgi:heme exporter protein D|nr:heme exporter protein CcmD [Gemmobacter sp.]